MPVNLLTKQTGIAVMIQIMSHAPNCSDSPNTSGWTILTDSTTGDAIWPSSYTTSQNIDTIISGSQTIQITSIAQNIDTIISGL
jgi:hypothetical protein